MHILLMVMMMIMMATIALRSPYLGYEVIILTNTLMFS